MLVTELMTMPSRHLHNLPVLCLLVLSLLVCPTTTFGYVWCVGTDGHVALEAARAGDCGMDRPAAPLDQLPLAAVAADVENCGPCHDISDAPRWGSARTRSTEDPAVIPLPLAPAPVAQRLSLAGRLLCQRLVADPLPRTPEPIRLHRTTVLLI